MQIICSEDAECVRCLLFRLVGLFVCTCQVVVCKAISSMLDILVVVATYCFHFRGSCVREGVMVMFYLTQKVAPFVDIYAIWGNDCLLPFLCGCKLPGASYLLAMPVTANLTSYICSTVRFVISCTSVKHTGTIP